MTDSPGKTLAIQLTEDEGPDGRKLRMGCPRLNLSTIWTKAVDLIIPNTSLDGQAHGALRTHERFRVHLWRIARESIPWFGNEGRKCPPCQDGSDEFEHLFSVRLFARVLWWESHRRIWNSPLSDKTPISVNPPCRSPTFLAVGSAEAGNFSSFRAIPFYHLWNYKKTESSI